MNFNYIKNKFIFKNKNLFDVKKNLFLENTNFVILNDGLRENLQFITLCSSQIYKYKKLNNKFTTLYGLSIINSYKNYTYNIGINEYDLKGVNYRFSLLKNILFLDLGKSHFQLINYNFNNFFFKLKKKWLKRLILVSFSQSWHNAITDFFRFKLKKVGPYKLKGFQFVNERIKLKAGKKPFK